MVRPTVTNPTNPAFAPTKTHVIEDTHMREATGESPADFWTLCTCGELFTTISANSLAVRYAAHIADIKGTR